ncbi:alpha/beta hydrolase, partial [Nostoc sp. CHAB 5834]|nr:alpha/beta hydrolase [Nostoc sp. CHAB 5834]
NMSYYLGAAQLLSKNGFNVVLFDYRGFGESDDFKIDSNYLFYSEFLIDYETVFYATKIRHKNKIGVLAFSMGGYFPLALDLMPDFIILDSPMLNPQAVISRLNKNSIKLPEIKQNLTCKKIPTISFWGDEDKVTVQEDYVACIDSQFRITYKGNHMQLFQKISEKQIIRFIEIITNSYHENK